MPAGYSGTPLPKKLGLKDGQAAAFVALPDSLADLTRAAAFRALDQAEAWEDLPGPYDLVHCFTDSAAVVAAAVPGIRDRLDPSGMLWMSWPKKASKRPTDVTEDVIRDTALANLMVDVKVCAVDEVWSGLKLVIRKEHRAQFGAKG